VQPEPQVPLQVVSLAQCEVQLAVQSTLQVFMCWQSSDTSDGKPVLEPPSLSAPPSPVVTALPPMLQVAPILQVQVVSLQVQAPVQAMARLRLVQPATDKNKHRRMRMPPLRAPPPMDTYVQVG
jgi:hypothetical protein